MNGQAVTCSSAPVSDRAVSLTVRSLTVLPEAESARPAKQNLRPNQRAGSATRAQPSALWSVTLSMSKGFFLGRQSIIAALGTSFIGCLLLSSPVFAGNLLPNGNFERSDPVDSRRPTGWDLPDGLGVQWAQSDRGKAIRLDTQISEIRMNEQWTKMGLTNTWFIPKADPTAIAETYGLSYYSGVVPVKTGQPYRVSFDYKGAPGGGKVWVRCFGQQAGEIRRLYEKIVFCEKKGTDWVHYQEVFFPTKYRPAVTEMRVMLYAYYPAGVYWFANISLEPITPEEYGRVKAETSR